MGYTFQVIRNSEDRQKAEVAEKKVVDLQRQLVSRMSSCKYSAQASDDVPYRIPCPCRTYRRRTSNIGSRLQPQDRIVYDFASAFLPNLTSDIYILSIIFSDKRV
jgi:hypothetical protein